MDRHKEQGSFTVEAILSMMLFVFAFLAVATLAGIAKAESVTQHAINQVAKEVAQYYYIAEKLGMEFDNEGVEEIDGAVQAIVDFASVGSDVVGNYSGNTAQKFGQMLQEQDFQTITNDVNAISSAAQNLYNSFGPILEDPVGVLSSFGALVKEKVANEAVSRLIAQPLCKALFPKYITSSGDADATLEKMGVVDGLDGIDFRLSSFAADGRSINVVIVYQMKIQGFGVFDDTLLIKQTASTAAWVTGKKLSEVSESETKWNKSDFERGKDFVAELKLDQDRKDDAVKAGVGIDFYDQDSNKFSSVHSINVFSPSYSTYQTDLLGSEPGDHYQLNKKTIKSTIKSKARELEKSIGKIGDSITMEDKRTAHPAANAVKQRQGELVIVFPLEAKKGEHLTILNQIREEIEAEMGIEVNFTYRVEALGEK